MSLELLTSIEKAEARAEEIRAEAQREARDILKSVEEACTHNERDAALQQRAMVQRVLEDARETANRRIETEAAAEAGRREAVTIAAKGRLEDAANLIFERVVGDGNR